MVTELFIDTFYILLGINLAALLLLCTSRIYFINTSKIINYTELQSEEPFVSIHLAICNEPPDIVMDTLNAFNDLEYANFEVIIISNNTPNLASWQPIEAYAVKFDHFRFFHFDKVEGYKAGALNIALEKTNPKAEYVFTVDSDYKLLPNALKVAVGSIKERKVDVLQFPQNYRNICSHTKGLQANYKHYFECYLSAMDKKHLGLPTGTLTLIHSEVFKKGLRWPTETITEDAHFGIELLSRKFTIGYCNLSIGTGTMPTSITDYTKQYKRWSFGNFQTLVMCLKKKDIPYTQKLRLSTMLFVWVNLLALPILISFMGIPFLIMHTHGIYVAYLLVFMSLILHTITQFFILRMSSKHSVYETFMALLVHIGTVEIGSFYWLTYIINSHKPFVRTNKFLIAEGFSLSYFYLPILLFISSIVCFLFSSRLIGFSLITISIFGLLGKLRLKYELLHSRQNLSKMYST